MTGIFLSPQHADSADMAKIGIGGQTAVRKT